ncbi:MAG: DEAD/DEAH box helicase [Eggerthellaceae bacterium]|nr:DEAD/DEAH box helicase [Eggerthellaceae bacterium]
MSQNSASSAHASNEAEGRACPAMPAGGGRATSPALSELMERIGNAAAARRDDGPIELSPTLFRSPGYWSIEFKVGRGRRSFVVKSISEFVQCCQEGGYRTYGKTLGFHHVPSAFDERSRALADLLQRALTVRQQTRDWWQRRTMPAVERRLELTDAEVVDVLDIMAGAAVAVSTGGHFDRSTTRIPVGAEPVGLSFAFEPVYDSGSGALEGIAAKAPAGIELIRSRERAYLWTGNAFLRCPAAWAPCLDVVEALLGSLEGRLFVGTRDLPRFAATLLPLLGDASPFTLPAELSALRPTPCKPRFYFDRDGDEITCDALAAYGETVFRIGGGAQEEATPNGDGDTAPGNRNQGGAQDGGAASPGAAAPGGASRLARALSGMRPDRDLQREAEAEALVDRYFGEGWPPATARLPLDAEEEAAALLFGGLAEFRSLGEVHATAAFERLLRDKAPRIMFGVALAGNLIDLTVHADELSPAELAALLSSYRKRKRYHVLKSGVFVNLEDCDLAQLDRLACDLDVTPAQLAAGTVQLPSFRAFYLDEEENLERDRSFTRYLESFEAVSEDRYRAPASLAGTLRPYQEEGFRWLSARVDAGFGAILADEMGLGKSLQIISVLLARRGEAGRVGPSLVVCPASLLYNWKAELERFAPELRVCPIAGPKRERLRLLAEAFGRTPGAAGGASEENGPAAASEGEPGAAADAPLPFDVLVTSYDTLRIDCASFAACEFWCCVLDEAQYIKNPAVRVTRAAKRVRARHRFALTGTPMENRLSDMWSIFDFLMPGILGPYARFRERFEQPIAGGDEEASARLRRLIGPFMLRRRKQDVLADLPEKLESVVFAELEGKQRKLYLAHEQQLRERLSEQKRVKGGRGKAPARTKQARSAQAIAQASGDDFSKHRVEVLAELTKLRQLCCDPSLLYSDYHGPVAKLDIIGDLVESAIEGGEKVLVFSQFTSFLARIGERLAGLGVRHYVITGATPKKKRLELVNAFNADATPAFLISLKAGGTGLNLTGASVVIHADPWWNAAAQNQATDRAHRIGQTHAVSVQKVIAKGTIEERILRLQQAKADLADLVVAASGTSLAGLSREDLLELLEG